MDKLFKQEVAMQHSLSLYACNDANITKKKNRKDNILEAEGCFACCLPILLPTPPPPPQQLAEID